MLNERYSESLEASGSRASIFCNMERRILVVRMTGQTRELNHGTEVPDQEDSEGAEGRIEKGGFSCMTVLSMV